MIDVEDLMTVDETARALRVSRVTVRRLARQGDLEAVRVGRQIRVPRAALSRLRVQPATPRPGRRRSERRVAA